MENINACPVCNATQQVPFLTCTDHTVSKKEFQIVACASCGFKFTNPRPSEADLGQYYISEEYVSHSGTKKGFIHKLYHGVRKYTLLKKLQLIYKYSKRGKLLDVGCGTGEFLDTCKKAGWETLGIEPSEQARNFGSKEFGIEVMPEEHLKTIPEQSFDVITLWHVLEHVPNLNERIEELKKALKNNGTLFVAVPNCSSNDAKHYRKFWAAYDVPRHLYHFTPADIRSLFEKHEMKVVRVLPMVFDSFYVSMLSEKYKNLKINYLTAFWRGFISNLKAIPSGESYSSQIYVIQKVRSKISS